MAQSSGGPPSLRVGTEVSAKYRGAFCEATVKTVQRIVKCKVVMKDCQTSALITDDEIKGMVKLGSVVEVKHPDTGQPVEAVINKLIDNSTYTVVFDDGDERTLRRTQLCLKGDKHFIESETLDNLPLSHPEHFGTPVLQNKKSKRKNEPEESDGGDTGEDESPRRTMYRGRHQELVGKLMLVDMPHRKGSSIPALVVLPDANSLSEVKNRDQILVRSFKDSKFVVVTRKDLKEFSRSVAIKNEDKTMRMAFEKALLFHDTRELPVGWDREEMLGSDAEDDVSGEDDDEYASEDEPFEEKDRFVAQLYKFMDERGTPINKGPCIANKDLNLYKLFQIVQKLGGYNKVTKEIKWPVVYSKMGLPSLHSNPAHQIKTAYKKYLDAYETFYRKLGSTMGTMSRPGRGRQSSSRSILNFRGREKSPRSPKPPVEKVAKEEPEAAKPKDTAASSVEEDQDTASIASEESDQTLKRTPRRDARSQACSKEDVKEKKEDSAANKKKDEKKDESPKVKRNDAGGKPKKDVSPGPRGKKEDSTKGKKAEEESKKDERKSNRKATKAEEEKESDKEVKKTGRQVRKEKEEERKEVKIDKPQPAAVNKESPKKRITRRKLLPTSEKMEEDEPEQVEKKELIEKKEPVEKKEAPVLVLEKKDVQEKKDAPKKMPTRETKSVEKKDKEIPRTLERRDSRASERKDIAVKVVEKKEMKIVEKKVKSPSEEKKPQKKEKRKDTEKEEEVESEKSDNEGDSDQGKSEQAMRKDLSVGCKLKVKYGRGKNQKIYIAKVVDTGKDGSHKTYLVHYAGWNTRYDEWIRADRVVAVLEKSEGDKPKASPKSLGIVTTTIKHAGAQKPVGLKNRSSIFRTPKLGTAKTRATRSSSSELLTPTKKLGKRLTRRGSTLTDSADSKSSDGHATSDLEDSETSEDKPGKQEMEDDEEILDVEQDDGDTTNESIGPITDKEEKEHQDILEELDKAEQDKEDNSSSENMANLDYPVVLDVKEESKVDDDKIKEESVESELEKSSPVVGKDKPIPELTAVVTEVKSERQSVAVAEMDQPVSEIRSLVDTQQEELKEETKEQESVPDVPSSKVLQPGQTVTEQEEIKEEDEEASPKLEIVEDGESLPEDMSGEGSPMPATGSQEESSPCSSLPPSTGNNDQSIPLLKRISLDEEKPPVKDVSEKGRGGLKGRKRDTSKERKKSTRTISEGSSSISEIPTLEPIMVSSVVAAGLEVVGAPTVPKCDPSPYDFEEETESSWQPELTKKWEPVQKVISTLKEKDSSSAAPTSEEGEEKEKKKVKKKAKKRLNSSQEVPECKVDVNIVSSIDSEKDPSNTENAPSLIASSIDAVKDKLGATKKKGRKKREADTEINKETIEQYESSVNSVVEALQKDTSPEERPPVKKRRTKRVSESDKKDSSRSCPSVKKSIVRDSDKVVTGSVKPEDLHKPSPSQFGPEANMASLPSFSTSTTELADLPASAPTISEATPASIAPPASSRKKDVSVCESQGFEPQVEEEEERPSEGEAVISSSASAPPFDNTPPTTPEHDEAEPEPSGQCLHKAGTSSSTVSSSGAIPSASASSLGAKCASESPSDNDVISTTSTDNLDSAGGGSGVVAQQSEGSCSSTDQDMPHGAPTGGKKRKQPEESPTPVQGLKKRKKVHGTRSRTAKKSPKYSVLDSISYKTDSQGSSSTTPNHYPDSPANKLSDFSKSPRPSKYNFSADLGEYLEGEERCSFLITKMKEIKSIYMNLKSEVASIDRRRKRARRKERDSTQSFRGERENSC